MRILIAEDDQVLADGLLRSLRNAGYSVDQVGSGTEADAALAVHEFDLVILDLGLPKLHGLEVLRKLRARGASVPVLILTAADSVEQRVKGLDLGADDFVTKPFDMDELLARLRAATRRALPDAARRRQVVFGHAHVDFEAKTASYGGAEVHLTPTEWHLLELLVRNPGKLITRRQLLTALRGQPDHTDPSYLRIYISQLRRKLEQDPARPRHLITEPGLGYRFQP